MHTSETAHGTNSPDATRLVIDGDLTIYRAADVKRELLDQLEQHDPLELDLSQVAQIDTAGIQLLVLAKRESQRRGTTLRIVAHSQAVQELIDFYNMAAYFGDPLVISAHPAP